MMPAKPTLSDTQALTLVKEIMARADRARTVPAVQKQIGTLDKLAKRERLFLRAACRSTVLNHQRRLFIRKRIFRMVKTLPPKVVWLAAENAMLSGAISGNFRLIDIASVPLEHLLEAGSFRPAAGPLLYWLVAGKAAAGLIADCPICKEQMGQQIGHPLHDYAWRCKTHGPFHVPRSVVLLPAGVSGTKAAAKVAAAVAEASPAIAAATAAVQALGDSATEVAAAVASAPLASPLPADMPRKPRRLVSL